MLTVILVILAISFLILGHEAGHFFAAKGSGMLVDEFGIGFPPRLFGFRKYKRADGTTFRKFFWCKEKAEDAELAHGTIYSVNILPFGGFVKIAGENGEEEGAPADPRLFSSRPIWQRSIVMLAGVFMNFILGWIMLSIVFMIGLPEKVVVGGIEAKSPAAEAGIKEGDIILGYTQSKPFIEYVNSRRGIPTQIRLEREGKELDLTLTPRAKTEAGQGAIGIYLGDAGFPRESFFKALGSGISEAVAIAWGAIIGFWGLLKSIFVSRSIPQDLVGPVGIVSIAAQTGKLGILYFLQLLSIISLNLAIMNLLPFPALDGGRFLALMIEKIKGSPLPRAVEGWINLAGFALLILLMALITIRDVGRL